MRTLVLDPPPPQLVELLERRRRMGADRRDEVWEGVYHVVPSPDTAHSLIVSRLVVLLDAPAREADLRVTVEFNMGVKDDFRIPDLGIHRVTPRGVWLPTAAIAVEVLSPDDETWEKLPFYAEHEVDELLIVDPRARSVTWLALRDGEYRPADESEIVDVSAQELADGIEWPDPA
jgi:Uma2 family endonuclease